MLAPIACEVRDILWGPASQRRYKINFAIPTLLAAYNPWDREFWMPPTQQPTSYIYVRFAAENPAFSTSEQWKLSKTHTCQRVFWVKSMNGVNHV